jgi:hypothetical protein
VSDGGIKTDPDKVSVVKNWPAIKNVKDLRKIGHNKPKIFDFRLEKLALLTF